MRAKPVSISKIFMNWWPLAASWLLMGTELPMVSAVMARLVEPKINLAAYGGVVFPISLIIEAPIIMLLAASTALSKDWTSYTKLRRFMMWAGGLLTLIHFVIAFTPLYYPVVVGIMGVPEEIIEPSRIGLMIMTPWTWSIAYRRFNQGILIRFERSRIVSIGTAVRLVFNASAMILAITGSNFLQLNMPGIAVGTLGIATGVIAEAVYIGFKVQPVLRNQLITAPPLEKELTWRAFYDFYVPLAMTSLLLLLVQPLGSAALSRMPRALESLAVWPVVGGFTFMLRSLGYAYNEVVVAMLDRNNAVWNLRRFTWILFGGTTTAMLIVAATPISTFWFVAVSGLESELANLARSSLWIALFWPGLSVLQNWFQGAIVYGQETRGITEAVGIFLLFSASILVSGIMIDAVTGLYMGLAAFVLGEVAQTSWLWYRSKPIIQKIETREQNLPPQEIKEEQEASDLSVLID